MLFWPKTKPRRAAAADSTAAELTREVAGVASDLYEPLAGYAGVRPNRDPLLAAQTPSAAYAYPYGLFEEALDKDAHLFAVVAQRKAAVLAWERRIVPADSSLQARRVADFVEQALAGIGSLALRTGGVGASGQGRPHSGSFAGGFEHDLCELLDAIPYGLAVSEIVWEQVHGSWLKLPDPPAEVLLPAALLSRHPRRFTFGVDGTLRLLTPAAPVTGEDLPERKFLSFAPYGRHEDPWGLPLLRSVWWLAWFKRQALKFWLSFAEKYGSPTAVLRHPINATDKEKRAYRRLIGSIQQETGLVVPEGVELSLLEAQRGGTLNTYHDLLEFCNREMSKALLGQTLTSEVGARGSLALGSVHYAVREDIVRQDAQALMALVNGQLLRWIVELNFPPEQRLYPRWELHPPQKPDLALELSIDRFFAERGLACDEAALYKRYGRQPASSGDAAAAAGAAQPEAGR